jgi:SAM-dependent methyltransferase
MLEILPSTELIEGAMSYTTKADELPWWYYSVEIDPGVVKSGVFPPSMVLLPRLNLSKIDLRGQKVADICTMEGLMPTLMAKGGAAQVVATDSSRPSILQGTSDDSIEMNIAKMGLIKSLHNVDFHYAVIPEKTNVSDYLVSVGAGQFDLVNLSGLLYHVFSPMHWIGAIRPLIREGGLAIISTNITFNSAPVMEFNTKGVFQPNPTTYWYISVPMLDYLMRYFRLRPLRCEYYKSADGTGYMSVVARAESNVIADADDDWMATSAFTSWDSLWFSGLSTGNDEHSDIRFKDGLWLDHRAKAGSERLDLADFVQGGQNALPMLGHERYTAVLRLSDTE